MEYPSYSLNIKPEMFTLQPKTETFISVSPKIVETIPKRGLIDEKRYCLENTNLTEAVKCYKGCFLKRFKVILYPFLNNLIEIQIEF